MYRHYHAAMPAEERETVQRDWSTGKVQVIVATIAFGMGINKVRINEIRGPSLGLDEEWLIPRSSPISD